MVGSVARLVVRPGLCDRGYTSISGNGADGGGMGNNKTDCVATMDSRTGPKRKGSENKDHILEAAPKDTDLQPARLEIGRDIRRCSG